MHDDEQGTWANVARETFEYSLKPWAGRKYVGWLCAWARPHPGDPGGCVQVARPIYDAFQRRLPGQRLDRHTAEHLGYPSVPAERELDRVRRDLHAALGRCDWEQAHDLDLQLRSLQEQVAASRLALLHPGAV